MKRRKLLWYLAAAALPLLFLVPVFWWTGLYPLGRNTLVWCDMRQQVMPLLMQLKDLLAGEVSPFYSLRAAGGMNLWGVLFFFVSSPLSILVLFWEKADFFLLANLMTLLKISLCSLGCFWFLRERHPALEPQWSMLLSAGYALSGYTMLFYQNSVWLDVMAVMPPLYRSACAMTRRGGGWGYLFWLTVLLMLQYYLGYAVLLFLILWAAAAALLEVPYGERGRFALRVGCFTAGALALSAPVWLPSLFEVMASARTVNVVASIAGGRWFTRLYTTLSFLLCSAALLPAAFLSLRRRSIEKSWVRAEWLLFLWLLLPLVFDPINKVWHTGSYQAFPVRYGFLTALLLVSLAAAGLTEIGEGRTRRGGFTAACAVLSAAALLVLLILRGHFVELFSYVKSLWVNQTAFLWLAAGAAGLFFAAVLILLLHFGGGLSRRVLCGGFAVLLLLQSTLFSAAFIGAAARDGSFLEPIAALEGRIDDEEFYRVKTDRKLFDVNLIGGIGYNNLGHYTSLTREDTLYTLKRLGYSAYWMETGSHGGTLVTDALLQNRYIIRNRADSALTARQIYSNGSYWLYESACRMPFGIVTGADAESISELPDLPRAMTGARAAETLLELEETVEVVRPEPDVTENLFSGIGEDGRMTLAPASGAKSALMVYHLSVGEETTLYFDCFDRTSTALSEPVNGSFSIWVNGAQRAASYPSQRENGLLCLGTFSGEDVRVTVRVNKSVTARSMGMFGITSSSVERLLEARTGEVSLTAEQNRIEGTASSGAAGTLLFLPVPYAEGWQAQVNGRTVTPLRVLGGFLALPLEAGQNAVSMRFIPEGMALSLAVAAAALLLLALAFLLRRAGVSPPVPAGRAALVLLVFLACLTAQLTSILPLALHWLL